MPRIKLDLTADKCIVLAPVQSSVFHSYADIPDGIIKVQSYVYEEAFGEKVRALDERGSVKNCSHFSFSSGPGPGLGG